MKKYITYVGQILSSKNKLEKAIQEFLKQNDRLILDKKDLETFKENIIAQINFINQENKRCTPKQAGWYNAGTRHKDFGITGVECIVFFIYEMKGEYEITK